MKRLLFVLLIAIFCPSLAEAQTKDTIRVMVYNLLNFPDGSTICSTTNAIQGRVDTLQKILEYVQPDVLMVCELQHALGGLSILNNALNANGKTNYRMVTYQANQSGFSSLNNAFYYNSDKLVFGNAPVILTDLRDINVYQMQVVNPDATASRATIDFMVGHLKAGSQMADEERRARACDSIRAFVDVFPTERNIILGGDFNMYSGTETGFLRLTSGRYPFRDPINAPTNWQTIPSWNFMHTQSTRSSRSINCGSTSGVDDRFDLLLTSDPVLQGTNHVQYLASTYDVIGNNGSTYNDDINDITNTSPEPRAILDALYYMSDHLPVVLDLEVTHPTTIAVRTLAKADLGLHLYPNPATQQLTIQHHLSDTKKVYWEINDMLGRTIQSNTLSNTQQTLDISQLPRGIYSLTLSTATQKQQKTFVKR